MSEAQINASRENGAKSQGPVTDQGKATCSQNATKHSLTSKTLIVAPEEREAYDNLIAANFAFYKPSNLLERHVIQHIAELEWKLQKADIYESGIFASGRASSVHDLQDVADANERYQMIESLIYQSNAKTLQNLTLQVSRTQRNLERRIKQYEAMRAEREAVEIAAKNLAMNSLVGDKNDTSPAHPTVGSVFSYEFLISRLEYKTVHPKGNIVHFDRAWGDPKAKVPA
jgi:hypothetical protein